MRRVKWLIAFLLLLQSLAAGAVLRGAVAHTRFAVGAVAFSEGYDCAADKLGSDKTPVPSVHSLCCILCSCDLSDKSFSFVATLITLAEFWAPDQAITTAVLYSRRCERKSARLGYHLVVASAPFYLLTN